MDLNISQFGDDNIAVEFSEDKIIIRFVRPEIRNPLSIIILEHLRLILKKYSSDQSIKTIVFTGADDVFASGANLREIAQITEGSAKEFAVRGQNLMNNISSVPQTTIAAINGFCFGGALDLALACNKRIASTNVVFCHPGANLGIITGWGGTQRLPLLVGEAKALEMFLTAKRIYAREALVIGLIDKIAENPLEYTLANY